MARKAIIGPKIVEVVERLLANGEAESQSEAFKMIVEAPDHLGVPMKAESTGSVAAGYYREKRKLENGGTNGGQRQQQPAKLDGTGDENVETLVSSLLTAAELLKQKTEENAELKRRLRSVASTLGNV